MKRADRRSLWIISLLPALAISAFGAEASASGLRVPLELQAPADAPSATEESTDEDKQDAAATAPAAEGAAPAAGSAPAGGEAPAAGPSAPGAEGTAPAETGAAGSGVGGTGSAAGPAAAAPPVAPAPAPEVTESASEAKAPADGTTPAGPSEEDYASSKDSGSALSGAEVSDRKTSTTTVGGTKEKKKPKNLSHLKTGILGVGLSYGVSLITAGDKYCGEFSADRQDPDRRKPICIGATPLALDFLAGFGASDQIDIIVGVRLNLQARKYDASKCPGGMEPCADGKGLFANKLGIGVMPGIRIFGKGTNKIVKFGGQMQVMYMYENFKGYRDRDLNPEEGNDEENRLDEDGVGDHFVGLRGGPVLQIDPHHNFGITIMPAMIPVCVQSEKLSGLRVGLKWALRLVWASRRAFHRPSHPTEPRTVVSVVEVKGLEKTFVRGFFRKRTKAVQGISFDVQAGEIFGFLGPNGAGKTTTMKMLMGLIHPTGGSATVLGRRIGDLESKKRVGYLPENPYFYDYLSAVEYMHMAGRIYGLDKKTRTERSDRLLDDVGLSMAKTRAMRSYSKGMMQRVGLAQALIGDPDLVVMDEPMSGLDPIGRKQVRDLLSGLRDEGKTVFFCTHILADAAALCDRVGIIVKGKMVDIGKLGELLGNRVETVDVHWRGDQALREQVRTMAGEHTEGADGDRARLNDTDSADDLVRLVTQAGGRILELTPHRMTLEELFVRDSGTNAEDMRS